MVALGAVTRNLKNSTLTIQDGAATPATLVVPIEEGDLNITERPPEAIPVLNRGALSHFAEGPDNPVTVSFTAKYVAYAGHTGTGQSPTVIEALKLTGLASGWTSKSACGPKTVDLVWTLTTPCTAAIGGVTDESETVTITEFHADEIDISEGEEYNTIRVSGKALVTAPTAARA